MEDFHPDILKSNGEVLRHPHISHILCSLYAGLYSKDFSNGLAQIVDVYGDEELLKISCNPKYVWCNNVPGPKPFNFQIIKQYGRDFLSGEPTGSTYENYAVCLNDFGKELLKAAKRLAKEVRA